MIYLLFKDKFNYQAKLQQVTPPSFLANKEQLPGNNNTASRQLFPPHHDDDDVIMVGDVTAELQKVSMETVADAGGETPQLVSDKKASFKQSPMSAFCEFFSFIYLLMIIIHCDL